MTYHQLRVQEPITPSSLIPGKIVDSMQRSAQSAETVIIGQFSPTLEWAAWGGRLLAPKRGNDDEPGIHVDNIMQS